MRHILFLILILFCMTEIVVPQNENSSTQVARCRFYLKNEKGIIEYFLPLIFQVDNYLPTHGHVTIKYMNSSLEMDTIFCHYYAGRAILSKNDYEAIFFLKDSTKVTLTFEYQTLRKDCSYDTHQYEWIISSEYLFLSEIPYLFQIKSCGRKYKYNTTIRYSTASSYYITYKNALIKGPKKSKIYQQL